MVYTRLRDTRSPDRVLAAPNRAFADDSLGVCLPFRIRGPPHGCWPDQRRQLHPVDTLHTRERMGIHRQTNIPAPFTERTYKGAGTSGRLACCAYCPMGQKRKARADYPDIRCRTGDGRTFASLHRSLECLQPESIPEAIVDASR